MRAQSHSTAIPPYLDRDAIRRPVAVLVFLIGVILWSGPPAQGQTFPLGFTATTLISTGLNRPIRLCLAPDGRLFIAEQGGAVRIWKEETGLLSTPYYTFPALLSSEGGLLGLALNPDANSEQTLFAYYCSSSWGPSRVVNIRAANPTDDLAIAGSETVLFTPLGATGAHNGGGLAFGHDGKLYVSVGERQVSSLAQSLTSLAGKVLRINSDGSIPEDNPSNFDGIAGTTTGINRAIYAVGVRNPFHLTVQPATGRIFFNDVGNSAWEEVNECFAGRNYGWPTTEGPSGPSHLFPVTRPLYSYAHGLGPNADRAIVGGVFYSPKVCSLPAEYYNSYFFADYYSGLIRRLHLDTYNVTNFASSIGGVTDLLFDSQGRMWLLSNNSNVLIRLEYTAPLPPALARQPKPVRICTGEIAHFSFVPAGTPPLAYQWRHDNVDLIDNARISGANMPELTINDVRSVDTGLYQCFISNVHGNVLTAAVELNLGMTGGSRTGNEIARFVSILQSGTANSTDLCHFDFDGNGLIEQGDIAGLIGRLLE